MVEAMLKDFVWAWAHRPGFALPVRDTTRSGRPVRADRLPRARVRAQRENEALASLACQIVYELQQRTGWGRHERRPIVQGQVRRFYSAPRPSEPGHPDYAGDDLALPSPEEAAFQRSLAAPKPPRPEDEPT